LGTVKSRVADKNLTFKSSAIIKLTEEWFVSISKEDWKQIRVCNPVQITEDQYVSRERLLDENQG
jgi:hypothetical protein